MVQADREFLELRGEEIPVVQHRLQAAGNAGDEVGLAQVARDHDELTIA